MILITAVGILGGQMASYLLNNGATVIILDYKDDIVDTAIDNLKKISNNISGFVCNALDEISLKDVSDKFIEKYLLSSEIKSMQNNLI